MKHLSVCPMQSVEATEKDSENCFAPEFCCSITSHGFHMGLLLPGIQIFCPVIFAPPMAGPNIMTHRQMRPKSCAPSLMKENTYF